MKPICVPCERFYRPKRNAVFFEEGMPRQNDAKPGRAEPDRWRSYKLWCGDLWECPDCNAQIIVGIGLQPVAEHYQPHYQEALSRRGVTLLVKDC